MDKVELMLVFLRVLQFFPFSIISPVVLAHLFLYYHCYMIIPIDRIVK
jgi:hypothetical protein